MAAEPAAWPLIQNVAVEPPKVTARCVHWFSGTATFDTSCCTVPLTLTVRCANPLESRPVSFKNVLAELPKYKRVSSASALVGFNHIPNVPSVKLPTARSNTAYWLEPLRLSTRLLLKNASFTRPGEPRSQECSDPNSSHITSPAVSSTR